MSYFSAYNRGRDLQIAAERLARDLAAEQSKPQDRAMQDEMCEIVFTALQR